MIKIFISTLLILTPFSYACAQEPLPPFMPASATINVQTLLFDSRQALAQTTVEINKTPTGYTIITTGQGVIGNLQNANWTGTAHIFVKDGYLYLQDSNLHIKDARGQTQMIYEKIFHYEKGTINWRRTDKNGKSKQKTFPIKGRTCDEMTMPFFIKPYLPEAKDGNKYIYLLTNEPKLYKSKMRVLDDETLTIGEKNIAATKIKLTADMGIIDDMLDRFVPKTFMWYTKDPPYTWLQYQGFEKDVKSNYVIMKRETIKDENE